MYVKIFSVGGTIDKVYFDTLSSYQIGGPSIREILSNLRLDVTYDIDALIRKDSLDMDDADRRLLRGRVAADPAERVLITHGTDTMVESARALSDIAGKTIVFTGAMEPAGFKTSDATFNVGFALAACQVLPHGSYIAMNGRVRDASRVEKRRDLGMFIEADPQL